MQAPIETLHLFPLLNEQLISFLGHLSPADWNRQTVARQWVVKDVATHMADINFRRISLNRDGWSVPPGEPITSNSGLVNYLNDLNNEWVRATKRLSPALLIEWLERSNESVYKIFKELDPFAVAAYPVSWAGQDSSLNWFDIAREYTERWHHQQQIRDALGDDGLLTTELYGPNLEVFMQAWPYTLRDAEAAEGTRLKTVITGPGGGQWEVIKKNRSWQLADNGSGRQTGEAVAAETTIEGAVAWKLFSKSWRKEDIAGRFHITGDHVLGEKILYMISVMA